LLIFGTILDLMMKLETLGFCYKKFDPLTWVKIGKKQGKNI